MHGVKHFIKTTGPPISAQAQPLPQGKLTTAKAELDRMEAMDIIQRSANPWTAPLNMVPKASNE